MKVVLVIRRALAVMVIAGLALAPLSLLVMAATPSAMSMQAADEMSPTAMTGEMASDMPCCPSKVPMPVDCDKCVFMAACMSKCITGLTATAVHLFLNGSDGIALQRNDSRPDGLGQPPPEHPPRTLV